MNSYEELPYFSDEVVDNAKEAIYKYDAVVNDGNLGTDNSHVMHFDPADSSASTEPAQR